MNRWQRRARAGLVLCACACASRGEAPLGADAAALQAALDSAEVAGEAIIQPARTADDELGVILGARVSPNGRWIAIVDAAHPRVKVIAANSVAAAFHVDRDTVRIDVSNIDRLSDSSATAAFAASMVRPVVAISNTRLLVFWPDSAKGIFYDLAGRPIELMDSLPFFPIAATAVSDSTWLVYGPSLKPSKDGASWVHCLRTGARAPREWTSAFLNGVRSDLTGIAVPVFSESEQVVYFEHNQRLYETRNSDGSVVLAARCGASAGSSPEVSVIATGPGTPYWGTTKLPGYTDAVSRSGLTLLPLQGGIGVVKQVPRKTGRRLSDLFYDDPDAREVSTSFGRLDGRRPSFVIPRDYRILDSRAAVGAVFATDQPTPRLYVVGLSVLGARLQ